MLEIRHFYLAHILHHVLHGQNSRALAVCAKTHYYSTPWFSPCCYRGWKCPRISGGSQCCTGQWWGCWRRKPQSVADGQHEDLSQSGGGAPWKLPGSDWWMYQGWSDRGRWWHQWQRRTSALLSERDKVVLLELSDLNTDLYLRVLWPRLLSNPSHRTSVLMVLAKTGLITLAHFRHLNTNISARF